MTLTLFKVYKNVNKTKKLNNNFFYKTNNIYHMTLHLRVKLEMCLWDTDAPAIAKFT